ncbi:hypothetical protein CTheo_7832 [Ceratobasidium theobromae]|uniref:Uncharacterized protein n=1 Tax=Ceratobasidium theobromae TaxID=1582974 RepID=A0A5N5QAR3_9AGAM|nr:hypothetical protein CTheo_7832 [Ceratobasidium theobromae]
MLTRAFILRRTIHTTPRLRVQLQFDKGGDDMNASTLTPSGKTYVVSEPLENETPYGVPAGVFTSGEPVDPSKVSSTMPYSSTSSSPPHPKTTCDAQTGNLSEQNPWPNEEQGRMGRDEAAKHRH